MLKFSVPLFVCLVFAGAACAPADEADPAASASPDRDGDGVPDADDAFPDDATESVDSDGDGVGDNADAFPNDASESQDSDNDGVGDNADAFPNDASESQDSDDDGVGDNTDAFPNDPSESADSDGDGVGDNTDAFPTIQGCPEFYSGDGQTCTDINECETDNGGCGDASYFSCQNNEGAAPSCISLALEGTVHCWGAEGSGEDAIGTNDMTVGTDVTYVADGSSGQAFHCSGESGTTDTNAEADVIPTISATAFTYEMWVRFESSTGDAWALSHSTDTSSQLGLQVRADGAYNWSLVDDSGTAIDVGEFAERLPLGQWAHLALVRDAAGDFASLMGGSMRASASGASLGSFGWGTPRICGHHSFGDAVFVGDVDSLRIWDRALAADELAAVAAGDGGCGAAEIAGDLDCAYGEWSDWSECSRDCELGSQDRYRHILVNGTGSGIACDGVLAETQDCNTGVACTCGSYISDQECSDLGAPLCSWTDSECLADCASLTGESTCSAQPQCVWLVQICVPDAIP